jgi:GH24 family phage-related lysozyme (muramidase)
MNRKPIFDAVRKILGRGFAEEEVRELDTACDLAEGAIAGRLDIAPRPIAAPPVRGRSVGRPGLDLIQEFEACEKDRPGGTFEAYPDPGSADGRPWTIGWGSTGPDIEEGTVWTQSECDERFAKDIQRYANAVSAAIGNAPTSQNQFDALVSFHYNTGAIGTATLTKKHKQGDFAGAAAEFARWNKNAGKVMRGLTRRRTAEAELYNRP